MGSLFFLVCSKQIECIEPKPSNARSIVNLYLISAEFLSHITHNNCQLMSVDESIAILIPKEDLWEDTLDFQN